ncbi:uncharacterized protein LOC128504010 [Spea bombifrons]|uniref:uncharacterized protein LOC128504010 n=1 Tax=Spea bombifrons TaxID=233779 RepID=UPI00234A5EEB|nr:uncharacterized protein LOC128504010 [Spea bombifrons]
MSTEALLHYPGSLSILDGETDFASGWTADDISSYDLDSQVQCKDPSVSLANNRLDSEDTRTVITESMSVTASDEEKLQLLNKNTELRKINAELMKLNQQWDEIYRNTTERMQHTTRALQDEVHNLRKHSDKLSLILEHEQNKREFYETSLLQEMKRNQKLQEYVRHLEKSLHYNILAHRGVSNVVDVSRTQSQTDLSTKPFPENSKEISNHCAKEGDHILKTKILNSQPSCKTSKGSQYRRCNSQHSTETEQDMNQLKEQLQALKCQTEIYAADYKIERFDRERMKTENEKLRKKEKEMREQMHILQEQLKIYEDDFQKERSDKQVLQRLLKSRPTTHEPTLVHRCNNEAHCNGSTRGSDKLSRVTNSRTKQ